MHLPGPSSLLLSFPQLPCWWTVRFGSWSTKGIFLFAASCLEPWLGQPTFRFFWAKRTGVLQAWLNMLHFICTLFDTAGWCLGPASGCNWARFPSPFLMNLKIKSSFCPTHITGTRSSGRHGCRWEWKVGAGPLQQQALGSLPPTFP